MTDKLEDLLVFALMLLRGARRALREVNPSHPIIEDITDFLTKTEKAT